MQYFQRVGQSICCHQLPRASMIKIEFRPAQRVEVGTLIEGVSNTALWFWLRKIILKEYISKLCASIKGDYEYIHIYVCTFTISMLNFQSEFIYNFRL